MSEEQGTFQTPNGDAKIGQALQRARKERGLTLDDVEQATKIRKRYLSGLEREDYGALPDAVYARGFLKTYANYLGLDGEELSRELKDQRKPRQERGAAYDAPQKSGFDRPLVNPTELTGAAGRKVSGAAVLAFLVSFLVVAAVVGTLYYVGRSVQPSDSSPGSSPPSAEQQRAVNDAQPPARGEEGGGSRKEAPADKPNGPQEPASRPAPDTLVVEVTVQDAPSWLSILTDGTLAYEQIAQPGFSQTFEAKRNIRITTGNAGAVGVQVNGQDVGRLGESGEVLTENFTLKSAS